MLGETLLTPTGETGLMSDGAEALYDGDGSDCDCCVDSIRVTLAGIQMCDGTYRDFRRADFDFYFTEQNPFPQPCCRIVHVQGECEAGDEWTQSSAGINGATFTVPRVTPDGANPQQWIGTFGAASVLAVQRVFNIGSGTPVYRCSSEGYRNDFFPISFAELQIIVTRRLRAGLGIYEWSVSAYFVNGNVSFDPQIFSRVLFQQPVASAPSTFTIQGDFLGLGCVLRTPFNGLESHSVVPAFSGLCPPGASACPISHPDGYQDFYRVDDGGYARRISRGGGACTIEL